MRDKLGYYSAIDVDSAGNRKYYGALHYIPGPSYGYIIIMSGSWTWITQGKDKLCYNNNFYDGAGNASGFPLNGTLIYRGPSSISPQKSQTIPPCY